MENMWIAGGAGESFLSVKLIPSSSDNCIEGVVLDENKRSWLLVRVRVIQKQGKANAALIDMLSKKLSIPKTYITLIRGQKSQFKQLHLQSLSYESCRKKIESLL
jgi:uncharacterized protein YggU (UPF0235/DUF167 family)